MKKNFTKFLFIAVAVIGMFFAKSSQGQTAYVSLDTLSNGDTIHYCTSQYTQVVLYKPTAALTNPQWDIQQPSYHNVFADSVILNTTNAGTIWFSSDQTSTIELNFFLVGVPNSPGLADINACGDIYSYPLDALNHNTGSFYTWSTGATTQNITATSPGTYWVHIDDGCGTISDTAIITADHTNDANLGPDQTICLYDTITLTSGNTNITTYAWSTSSSASTITVSQAGSYSITTTDNSGCVSTDTMNLIIIVPYDQQQICMVEYDTLASENRINWDQHLGERIDSINIEKQISLTEWESIGVVPNTITNFLDTNSTPQTNSDSYRILVIDSCGNKSSASDAHKTITLLTSYTPGTGVMGFNWSHYLVNGILVAPTYTIYGIDTSGSTHVVGTVPGSQNYYNWTTPDLSYIKFFVGFTLSCGAKTDYLVRSNYTGNPAGIDEYSLTDQIHVYPTLTNGPITIMTDLFIKDIKLYNTLGQVLLVTKEKKIDIPYHGLYFLHINTDKGVMVTKIMIQ